MPIGGSFSPANSGLSSNSFEKRARTLQKRITTETQSTQRGKHRGESRWRIQPRPVRGLRPLWSEEKRVPRNISCHPPLFCPSTLRVQTGSGARHLRPNLARVGPFRPSGRSPRAEGLHFDGTPCVQGDGQAFCSSPRSGWANVGSTLGLRSVFLCALCVSVVNLPIDLVDSLLRRPNSLVPALPVWVA